MAYIQHGLPLNNFKNEILFGNKMDATGTHDAQPNLPVSKRQTACLHYVAAKIDTQRRVGMKPPLWG